VIYVKPALKFPGMICIAALSGGRRRRAAAASWIIQNRVGWFLKEEGHGQHPGQFRKLRPDQL
jgi:energy-coupling factor transporter ATP-binding protein EcfA2